MMTSSSTSVNDDTTTDEETDSSQDDIFSVEDKIFIEYRTENYKKYNDYDKEMIEDYKSLSRVMNGINLRKVDSELNDFIEMKGKFEGLKIKTAYNPKELILTIGMTDSPGDTFRTTPYNDNINKITYTINIDKALITIVWQMINRLEICQMNYINTFKSKSDCLCIESRYIIMERVEAMDKLKSIISELHTATSDVDFISQKSRSVISIIIMIALSMDCPSDLRSDVANRIVELVVRKHNSSLNGVDDILQFCMIEHHYNPSIDTDYGEDVIKNYLSDYNSFKSMRSDFILNMPDLKGQSIGYVYCIPEFKSIITFNNYINDLKIGGITCLSNIILTEKGFGICKANGTTIRRKPLRLRALRAPSEMNWKKIYKESIESCVDMINLILSDLKVKIVMNMVSLKALDNSVVNFKDLNKLIIKTVQMIEKGCSKSITSDMVYVKSKNSMEEFLVHEECLDRVYSAQGT